VLDFVAGGHTNGKPDKGLIIAMDGENLYYASGLDPAQSENDLGGGLIRRPLPCKFAKPVVLGYMPSGARILGPLTHGKTVSLAVSPSDSNWVAVTGWNPDSEGFPSNQGPEVVMISNDAGKSWINATGNLREASGVVGRVRPGGLLMVDLLENRARALLVGTSNGVMVSFLDTGEGEETTVTGKWSRLGSCSEFPIVLTAGLSYEHN